jgi:DMSO/TMAO reductase YedYZ molybdopterin-dependent catalytic subunit
MDHTRRSVLESGVVGIGAGLAALAASFAVVGDTPAFVGAGLTTLLTVLSPGVVVTAAIQTLGSLGQPLLFASALALWVVAVALLVAAARSRLVEPVATLAVAAAVAAATLSLTDSAASAAAAGAAAGVVTLAGSAALDSALPGSVSLGRRRVLRAGATAGILALAGGAVGAFGARSNDSSGSALDVDPQVERLLATARERSFDVAGLEGLVSEGFYQVDINSIDPDLSAEEWSLRVTGAVESEATYDYDDLTALSAEHRFETLRCVGERLNGTKTDTALWTGVPLTELLDDDLPDECCVMVRAADDYFEEFPLSALRNGFLAYRMNGGPLPRGHGHPVRALIPGHWGEINVKWLTEIEVLDEPADGYWEKRGWHGTGPVNTVAKLHATNRLGDGRVEVAGHAYAGTRGIERVEVSTDGGESWTTAELSDSLPGAVAADGSEATGEAEDAWRMWRHEFAPDGETEVVVRAVDGTGTVQPSEEADAFPSGPSGWVRQRVSP